MLRQSQELVYDPVNGDQLREVWTGTFAALTQLANALKASGVRCSVSQEAGRCILTALFASISKDEAAASVVDDRYEIATDFIQESIYANPSVIAAATALNPSNPMEVVAYWRQGIEEALTGAATGGPKLPSETGFTNSTLIALYQLALRGALAYEIERPVLSRVRTIPIAYSAQVVLDALPKVYSLATLASTFTLPSAIVARLPASPTTAPPNTAWAWKKRRDASEFSSSGKVVEVKDWVFALWSTVLYEYVP